MQNNVITIDNKDFCLDAYYEVVEVTNVRDILSISLEIQEHDVLYFEFIQKISKYSRSSDSCSISIKNTRNNKILNDIMPNVFGVIISNVKLKRIEK